MNRSRRYVIDTHVLYWYSHSSRRLSKAARAVFREIEGGEAVGVIPVIVLLELHSLLRKLGMPETMISLLNAADRAATLHLDPITRQQLVAYDALAAVPEMHDRLIAASALVHNCPLVTADPNLHAASAIATIW